MKPTKPIAKFDHLNKSETKGKSAFSHMFKNEEMGAISRLGKRFSDRAAIGKRSAQIVGIAYYENEGQDNELLGFQANYMIAGTLKKGGVNCLEKKKMPAPKKFSLESGDHYKTLEVVTGGKYNNIIGMALVSYKG